jgi:hypothetical protein
MNEDRIEILRGAAKGAAIGFTILPLVGTATSALVGATICGATLTLLAAVGAVGGGALGVYYVVNQQLQTDNAFKDAFGRSCQPVVAA